MASITGSTCKQVVRALSYVVPRYDLGTRARFLRSAWWWLNLMVRGIDAIARQLFGPCRVAFQQMSEFR